MLLVPSHVQEAAEKLLRDSGLFRQVPGMWWQGPPVERVLVLDDYEYQRSPALALLSSMTTVATLGVVPARITTVFELHATLYNGRTGEVMRRWTLADEWQEWNSAVLMPWASPEKYGAGRTEMRANLLRTVLREAADAGLLQGTPGETPACPGYWSCMVRPHVSERGFLLFRQ